MELFSNLAYSLIARGEPSYCDLNENINKLIEELGERLEKDLVSMEEQILLGFKDRLLSAQEEYRELQKNRNEEIIKQKVLLLKNEQERLFGQEELKSLEMNKLYDKIKVELKKNMEYEHELHLEIKFLTKQLAIAKKKAEMLDQEIREAHQLDRVPPSATTAQTYNLPKIAKTRPLLQTTESDPDTTAQRIIKNKIETMNEYLQLLCQEEPMIEQIVSKLEVGSCRSELQKEYLVDKLFREKEFKQYLYKVLFRKKKTGLNK